MGEAMKTMEFKNNWNRKLDCMAFVTIRPGKYEVGDEYKIMLKQGKEMIAKGVGEVKQVKRMRVCQLNDYMAYLDSGYSAEVCKGIIQKMYHLESTEVGNFEISLVLIKYK